LITLKGKIHFEVTDFNVEILLKDEIYNFLAVYVSFSID